MFPLGKADAQTYRPRRPLLGVAILFALGIYCGSLVLFPALYLFSSCFVLLALFFWKQRVAFLYAVIFLGGALAQGLAVYTAPLHLKNQFGERGANVWLRGVVRGMPTWEERPDSRVLAGCSKLELQVSAWKETNRWTPAEGRVMVILPVAKEGEPPHYGDELEVRGALARPDVPMNFGQFDYRKELERQGIYYVLRTRNPEDVIRMAQRRGNFVVAAALDGRAYLMRALHWGVEDEEVTRLLDAMLLGYRQKVITREGLVPFKDQFEAFQTSGVAHVFAINGLHVGLVAAALILLLQAFSLPRVARLLAVILLLTFYTLVTGARPGAVRSLLMASVLLAGLGLRCPSNILNSLGCAALLILLLNPLELFGGGFQLSFVVVTAIVLFAPPLIERMRAGLAPDPWIPPRCVSRWRQRLQPAIRYSTGLVGASIAACVGTLPLMALFYNLFAPVALLANLVVIPALMGIVGLGIFSATTFWISPWLAAAWNNANWLLVKCLTAVVRWGDHFSWSHQYVVAPPFWVVGGYYALLLLLASGWLGGARWRQVCVALVTMGGTLLWWAPPWASDQTLQITVLHTNGGQAIFVEPLRGEGFLLDAGSESAGKYVVTPFLRSRGVDQLASLALSHGMASYVGGIAPVLEKIPVTTIFDSGAPSHSKILEELRRGNFPRRAVRRGDEIKSAPDWGLRVLHPPRGCFHHRADDNSLVLLLEFQGKRVLFTSAAGETVEKELLANNDDIRADVIVKGQHERESSCSEAFLDRVKPHAVVFSVGDYPRADYLRSDVLERLRRKNISVYRTDEDGSVRISLGRDGIHLEAFRPAPNPASLQAPTR